MSDKRIPVILDTDIGSDIDDTWALAMLLKCPELDVKLVVSATGDTTYRAKLIAKMLRVAGRTDVPVGIGVRFDDQTEFPQNPWVKDFDFKDYPGTVHGDGVGAIVDTIMTSPDPVTLICIGPVPNIGAALEREPRIVDRTRFVGMHGSVYKGYGGSVKVSAEYNVAKHTSDCREALSAAWDITITPLDTCGLVVLKGEKYQRILRCKDPLVRTVVENYRMWLAQNVAECEVKSSILFDTVAVYLAFSERFLKMQDIGIRVTDDGYTVPDPSAKRMRVATDWENLGAFEDFLVDRLTSAMG